MDSKVKLSICMPTYNRVEHLQRQILFFVKEIENFNLSNIEIIISDNASTDGTKILLNEYVGKYSWLKINSHLRNIGAYNNMKWLLTEAKGDYIWIPGDDDYLKKGLIRKVISIIEKFHPSYIYLSRRTIDEKTHTINFEGKTHPVSYDIPCSLTHKQIYTLVKENYGDLKFQTSSIFLRKKIIEYDGIYEKIYDKDTQANAHSLYRSIRSLQEGSSFFVSDIVVLNGNDMSWKENFINYTAICDKDFSKGLLNFDFTKKECRRIINRQLAAACLQYTANPVLRKLWKSMGYPGASLSILPQVFYLLYRKILRILSLTKSYSIRKISYSDFVYDSNE